MKNLYSIKLHLYKLLITLLFILYVLSSYGESSSSELEALLNKKITSKEQIDKLLQLIRNDKNINPTLLATYSQKALNISDSVGYKNGFLESSLFWGFALRQQSQYDSALLVLNRAINRAKSNSKKELLAELFIERGAIFYKKGISDSAMIDYEWATGLLSKSENNILLGNISMNKGSIFSDKGNYKKAIELYIKSAEYYANSDEKRHIAVIYNNIAVNFKHLQLYDQAISYYKKAIKINKTLNYHLGLSANYSNIGTSYKYLDSVELSKAYYEKSLQICEQINHQLGIAQNLLNLGNYYLNKQQYDIAEQKYWESLGICKKINSPYGTMMNLSSLGEIYKLKKKYKQSLDYYKSALKLANQLNVKKHLSTIHQYLSELNYEQEDFKGAYENFKKFHTLKDSISGIETQNHILELEKKYQTEVKEREILALEKTSLNQKFIIAVLVAVALLLFFLYQWVRHQRCVIRRKQQLANERNKHLEEKIELKNSEVLGLASQFVKAQDIMANAFEKVNHTVENSLDDKKGLGQKINRIFKKSLQMPELDSEFNKKLDEANEAYFNRLLNLYPELSPTELKICALLRMNLSTKEIAQVCNRSTRTIDFTRNNIRKRMNLQPNDNLTTHLITLN